MPDTRNDAGLNLNATKFNPASNRRLGVLISGRGSNLQALIDAVGDGRLDASIVVVISNRADAEGLDRARRAGIEALHISHRGWPSRDAYDRALVEELRKRSVGLVCLAGFMRLLGPAMIDAFPDAIVNIHPALLPAFGGKGMYGRRVHAAVIESGARESGATVHFVDEEYDRGPIVAQRRVAVLANDTPESLAARVLAVEHELYPQAVDHVCGALAAGREPEPMTELEETR